MTSTNVNVPLLRKAVEWAEAEAAKPYSEFCQWDQAEWVQQTYCGTRFCIAGYVAQLQDARFAGSSVVDGRTAQKVAAEALGCGHASALFAVTNTIEDVRRIAEDLAGERL